MKKICENTLKCEFPSLSQNEALARSVAGAFIMQLNPTVSELADIKCAVSEAVTNCTVHAYPNTVGIVVMTMKAYSDRTVKIEIRDRGVGIEDIGCAMQPLFTTDPEGERSGMGFTVMESFTDSLRVTSRLGRGTRITLTKILSKVSPVT
ncbi:MAG: anti-sigma F factor [Ruminococcaceae bacterium]|nr:anti-sigma F factor [Oscillospiraceae bacterium]